MRAMTTSALALTNGKIWTGNGFASSVTIRDGRVVALDGEIPVGAQVLDLRGRLVTPGFIDNHLHFVMGSAQLDRVQLRDAKSLETFRARIAAHARTLGAGRWVLGGGWDEQRWMPATLPSRTDLDADTPHNPVFVTRLDLHMGLANSIALQRAGITRDTPDPAGGTIVRDAAGEPTGLLKDAAIQLVSKVIPPLTLHERVAAMRRGLQEAARHGVTSFCDMGMSAEAFEDFRAYQQLEREGALTARVWMYLPIAHADAVAALGIERGFGSSRLRIAGFKGFADGSLGSSTAAFREPYEGDCCNHGLLMQPMQDGSMERWVALADEHELQLAIHAIGDRANADVLALLEARPDRASRRFRIEHAQHLDAELVQRFAEAGVIASMQPYHAADDGRWAVTKIGAAREAWAFPFRSLLDAGASVTFGSDWPVAPIDPLAGIHAAVTRRPIDGSAPDGWIPQQKISVTEGLRCYTTTNASAIFAEREIGTLAPGMRADLVVLSHDLFEIAPEALDSVQVELTILDGSVIYSSGSS
jgi:predicted amidohydrolase YtcJ